MPFIFQTISNARSNRPSLEYQMCTLSDCKDGGIWKYKFSVPIFF